MPDIKFGMSQTSNPTPSKVNLYVRAFTIAASVFMGWMATVNFIGDKTEELLYGVLGLLVGLVNALAPLFGIQINPNTEVKAEDITAMDEPEKKTD